MKAIRFFLAGLVAVAAVGCGGGNAGVAVEGTLVKGGTPYTLETGESVTIKLDAGDGKTSFSSTAQPDGTFGVAKSGGGGIPFGKYKVSWVHQRSADQYTKKAAFKFSKDNADEWDVSASNRSFTLDIGKK